MRRRGLEADATRERTARVAAEQRERDERARATAAEQEAKTARTEMTDSRLSTVETGLSSAQTEGSAAEAAYAQAMAEGNFAEAGKQQRRMARAEAERRDRGAMTVWIEIPQMLARKTRFELIEMRKISAAHRARFARISGPAARKERRDAGRMIDCINEELELRSASRAVLQ